MIDNFARDLVETAAARKLGEACIEIGVDARKIQNSKAFREVCRQYLADEITKMDFQHLVDKIALFNKIIKK